MPFGELGREAAQVLVPAVGEWHGDVLAGRIDVDPITVVGPLGSFLTALRESADGRAPVERRSWPTCAGTAPACCGPASGASPCWTPTLSRSAPPNCGPGPPRTGVELVRTAIGRVIEDGSARDLLRWTERWRSTLHATTTRQDPALTAELGKLREAESDIGGVVDADREANRRRIEERIRRLTHGSAGDGEGARRAFDVGELLVELGDDTTLAGVVAARGTVYVVVAKRGRVRRFEAGRLDRARDEVEYARFALRGAAVASPATADALLAGLEPALARLEETLLGPALRAMGDGLSS